jgi:predicted protein tyrosine phosphatase
MIHVCSLARLHDTVDEIGAHHVVTLLRDSDLVVRPKGVEPEHHLIVGVDDITCPIDGYTHPCEEHLQQVLDFIRDWDQSSPLVVHCYAGISRSTATAYTAACALNPGRDEAEIARALRRASPTAYPNPLIVSLADGLLGREGRMVAAIETIGRGAIASEAEPFRLDIA